MNTKQMMNIGVEHIHPHPDNPRKKIGDVSELAESIKKNGIMQNLTVIPIEGRPGEYMALIGHRRHAAAQLAGIAELPCMVVEGMSMKEQVSTMLEENMQRDDLTIYEQAQGFQMMLDLGETEETIAQKTGFSKSTIRRRLNIAKLDQEELRKKDEDENFQLSLTDLYELEKIPDVELRDEILREATDSNNLIYRTRQCLEELKKKANEEKFKVLFEKMGVQAAPESAKNDYYSKWDWVAEFSLSEDVPENIDLKRDPKTCFYLVMYGRMKIIEKRVKEKKKPSAAELKQKEQDRHKRQLKKIQKEMAEERAAFIRLTIEKKFAPEKKIMDALPQRIFQLMMDCECWMSNSALYAFLSGQEAWRLEDDEKKQLQEQIQKMPFVYSLLVYAEKAVSDKNLEEWNAEYYKRHGKLHTEMCSILKLFGFSYSNKEFEQVVDGTHELFTRSKR